MDYTVALYIERIPGSIIRNVAIGGIDQKCLCIPIDPAIFHMAKSGKRFLQITLREKEEMLGTETHTVYFSYPNPEMVKKENAARWCGRCSMSQPMELNMDTTNTATAIGYGSICLDDIPEDAIFTQPATGKRYLRIGIKPLDSLDRGLNTHLIFVNPEYGASHGRRASLANGMDAPLVELGRLRQVAGEGTPPTDEEKKAAQEAEESQLNSDSMIGDYKF